MLKSLMLFSFVIRIRVGIIVRHCFALVLQSVRAVAPVPRQAMENTPCIAQLVAPRASPEALLAVASTMALRCRSSVTPFSGTRCSSACM